MAVIHGTYGDEVSRLLRDVESLYALGPAARLAVDVIALVIHECTALAEALLADDHDGVGLRIADSHHAHHLVFLTVQLHAGHTRGGTSHGAHGTLVETDGTSVAVGDDNLVVAVCQLHADHAVSFVNFQGDDTIGTGTGVLREAGLLDDTPLGTEEDIVVGTELGITQLADAEACLHLVVGLKLQHVLDGTSLVALAPLGKFVYLQPVAAALLREEHHRVVHGTDIHALDEVAIARAAALSSYSTTALGTELSQRGALDVAQMTQGNYHLVIGIEILGIELLGTGHDDAEAGSVKLLLDLNELILHDLAAQFIVGKDFVVVLDFLQQLVVFVAQVLLAQTRELSQAHINDGLGLKFIQVEAFLQVGLGLGGSLAALDDVYHLVNVVAGNDESLKDVGTLLGLLQVIARAADDHLMAVLHEIVDDVAQGEQTGSSLHQGNAVDTETRLQGGHLEEFVHHHAAVGITLHVHDDAHTFAV